MPNIDAIEEKAYHQQWIIEYQATKKLSNTTRLQTGVVGGSYDWPRVGPLSMTERAASQSPIATTDQDYQQIVTPFKNYDLMVATDLFDQAKINVSDRQQQAKNSTDAVGRQEDQVLINTFDTAASGHSTIADDGTNLPINKIIEGVGLLNESSVPFATRYLAVGPKQINSLVRQERAVSSDFSNVKPLMSGMIDNYMGVTIIMIPDQFIENIGKVYGLPKTGDIRTCFMWQQSAAGYVYGAFSGKSNPSVSVDWNPTLQSWMTISILRAGASLLLEDGLVKIECDETAL